jgi:hypothetical protein
VQRDVSARKAAEAAVQVREQALSNLNEGITICDVALPDCPVVYCNAAFLRWGDERVPLVRNPHIFSTKPWQGWVLLCGFGSAKTDMWVLVYVNASCWLTVSDLLTIGAGSPATAAAR